MLRLVLPPIPDEYLVDTTLPVQIPTPMFANDQWGNCVIAARAHQTLRFEGYEQKRVLPITDQEVLDEYWKEGKRFCFDKKPDRGLVLLDSLKNWRSGWTAGGQPHSIYAFAEISRQDMMNVKAGVYLLGGATAGIMLSQSALDQFDAGLPWDVVDKPGRLLGGHAIDVVGYTKDGPICVTWGKLQPMTWRFWLADCDEAFACVDSRNRFTENSPVDAEKLDNYLKEITK
ncbi:MAG: hypothetical protein WC359_12325 [Dehalococcoidia bacterium]